MRPVFFLRRFPSPLATSLAALLLLGAAATGATGCKSAGDKAQDRPTPPVGEGRLQLTDAGLRLVSDAGTVSLGADAVLPADLPKAIPVYPAAKVNMAARGAGAQGKAAWSLSLETGDERSKVLAFYASGFGSAFTKASDLALGDTQMTVWQSAQYDVTVMIAPGSSDQTTVTMTVSAK